MIACPVRLLFRWWFSVSVFRCFGGAPSALRERRQEKGAEKEGESACSSSASLSRSLALLSSSLACPPLLLHRHRHLDTDTKQ